MRQLLRFSTTKVYTTVAKRYRLRTTLAFSSLLGIGSYNWLLYFADIEEDVSHIVRVVPSRFLSRVWGRFTGSHFSSHFISLYSKVFGCDMKESIISETAKFATLSEFFCRSLKEDSRPVCSDLPLASPCDGKVLNFGTFSTDTSIEQIKGSTYSVKELLGCELPHSTQDRVFHYMTIYLSPGDYHHFHSPADWRLKQATHIPGDLLPVSPWILNWLSDIFSRNERVVLTGDWRWGFFSFIAVGAYNVGNIRMTHVPDIHTNITDLKSKQYQLDEVIQTGQEVGEFKLGSTIVLVFEASKDFAFIVSSGTSVKFGEPIGVVVSELNV